ncbi:MAG: hypothetical protein F6J92_18580 [Symploca sp. SIO1A3]|nr:hypothetical protein [Symploca sp. SIO1A3]
MSGTTSAGCLSVLFKQHRTLIDLVYDIVGDVLTLSHQEVLHPYDGKHGVVHADQLCDGRAVSV